MALVGRSPAEVLRFARTVSDITQAELARRAGTTQAVVSRIERSLASPNVRTLAGLLEAAGRHLVVESIPTIELLHPDERGRLRRYVSLYGASSVYGWPWPTEALINRELLSATEVLTSARSERRAIEALSELLQPALAIAHALEANPFKDQISENAV